MPDRLTVGQRFLEPLIGVRVPIGQLTTCKNKKPDTLLGGTGIDANSPEESFAIFMIQIFYPTNKCYFKNYLKLSVFVS